MLKTKDGTIYGVARNNHDGGVSGVVFRLNQGSFSYSILLDSKNAPNAPLFSSLFEGSDGLLYCIAGAPGLNLAGGPPGTVTTINRDGTGARFIHFFNNAYTSPLLEGADGWLYGLSRLDGEFGRGTVFKMSKNGSSVVVLHNFAKNSNINIFELLTTRDGSLYCVADWTLHRLGKDATTFERVIGLDDLIGGIGGVSELGAILTLISGSDDAFYGTFTPSSFTSSPKWPRGLVFRLDLPKPLTPPTISVQPVSQTVNAGSTVLLNVVAGGAGPLTYRWQLNGVDLAGATGATLTLANVQAANSGKYTVIVSNSVGSVTSDGATLTVVIAPPSIAFSPLSQTAGIGENVVFRVTATGSEPLRYEWRFNGVAIPGANSSAFVILGAKSSQVGDYSVEVSNSAGSKLSSPATLSLLGINTYAGLTIVGKVGGNYRIDFLNDVKNANSWVPLTNVSLDISPYLFIDRDSPSVPKRFYRAVLLP